jgi:hypothetical protein
LRQALATVVGLEPAVAITANREPDEAWRQPEEDSAGLDDAGFGTETG